MSWTKPSGKLTPRQRIFVDAYTGNATEAAKAAGCSKNTAAVTGSKWMKMPHVITAIRKRDDHRSKGLIAKRTERQEMWTTAMRDETLKMEARLRASELLGKSEADFTEKHEIKGELTLLDLVRESMDEEPDVEEPAPPAEPPA